MMLYIFQSDHNFSDRKKQWISVICALFIAFLGTTLYRFFNRPGTFCGFRIVCKRGLVFETRIKFYLCQTEPSY